MLEDGLSSFCDKIKEHLNDKEFSGPQKEQFVEGLFFALHAMSRFAPLLILTPFERETFIESAKAWIYSEAEACGMNTEKLQELEKSGRPWMACCLMAAEKLNEKLGVPLSTEEKLQLGNAIAMAKK